MTVTLPSYSRWLACYRHGAWWLAGALLCALMIGVSARASQSLGPLALFPFGLLTVGGFVVLVISSLCSAWRCRNELPVLGACLLAPLFSAGLYVVVLAAVWWTWGVLPMPVNGTNDFEVSETLASGDGAWLAVHAEDLSGGPATGASQDVYLLRNRPGSTLFFKDRVFSLECIQDFRVLWMRPRTLQISYVVGDQFPGGGLITRKHLPLIHDPQDEWRFTDPVRVVEARRIVHGNLC